MSRRALLSLAAASTVAAGCDRLRRPPPIRWVRTIDEAEAITYRHPRLSDRPLFLMFGASWDTASKELEEVTFTDPSVRLMLNDHYIAVSIDCSDDESEALQRTIQRFKMQGTPTMLTYAPRFEREIVRITEYVTPAQLLAKLGHPS